MSTQVFYRIGTLLWWSVTGSDREWSWIGRWTLCNRCVRWLCDRDVAKLHVGLWLNSYAVLASVRVQIAQADEGLTTAAAAACLWWRDDGCGGHEEGNNDRCDRSTTIPLVNNTQT